MSARVIGAGLAALCGIAIAYTTLQPELERQQAERRGEFREQKPNNDRSISQAIMSDLKEAKQQVEPEGSKGFAWGIREAIWRRPESRNIDTTKPINNGGTQQMNSTRQKDMEE